MNGFFVPYFDDVLVASEDGDQQLHYLKQAFQLFEEYSEVLNASKSVLGETSGKCLDHTVTAEGISSIPEIVAAVTNFPKPDNVKEPRRFFAIYNFYRRFILYPARMLAVVNSYLRGTRRNDRTLILRSEN
ncbi:retrovirus-related Pol polyprotein from transposon 297 [Nephila pilipes]|uniref:Retrovirus-related Pol polyprotein from transposon 297 n=1 Tax=Nephila pilipes TaxID=299642 RepID=A0A8X6QAK8_NEPPI|nr:retrovirus-related Pol polyprotein from transposon 297 [Nephila pilipes]